MDKTVNLSEAVYKSKKCCCGAVAGSRMWSHAVQHAQAYEWLTMRSKMVPMVNMSSSMSQWLIMGGLVLGLASKSPNYWFLYSVAGLAFNGYCNIV